MLGQGISPKTAGIVAHLLLEVDAVSINTEHLFKFVSGILSPVYIDNRKLISYPKARKLIVDCFVEALRTEVAEHMIDLVAGVATSGIPWSAWIAHELQVPMIYVRPVPKDRGMQKQVEGIIQPSQRAIVVEDLVTTGLSSSNAAEAVRSVGGIVNHCIALFSFEAPSATERFNSHNLSLYALTNLASLLKAARDEDYISALQSDIIREWSSTTLAHHVFNDTI